MNTNLNPKADFFVFCDLITRKFLLEYAKSNGVSIDEDHEVHDYEEYPYVGWDGTICNQITVYHRKCTKNSYTVVTLAEFIHFLDTYEKPLEIGGHKVVFGKDHIQVGCTTVTKDTIKEVLKRLEK